MASVIDQMEDAIRRSQEILDKMESSRQETRELLSELHSSLKSAKTVQRELADAKKYLDGLFAEIYSEDIVPQIKKMLDEVIPKVQSSLDAAIAKVMREFEKYSNLLMFGNEQGRGKNILEDAAIKIGKKRRAEGV